MIVPLRNGAHGAKSRYCERSHGGFRTAANHDICVAILDHSIGFADGVGSGGTRGCRSEIRPCRTPLDGNLSRCKIHDCSGNEEWRDPAWPLGEKFRMLTFDNLESADAAPDTNADAVTPFGFHVEERVLDRKLCGGEGKLDEPRSFFEVLFLDKAKGIKA